MKKIFFLSPVLFLLACGGQPTETVEEIEVIDTIYQADDEWIADAIELMNDKKC